MSARAACSTVSPPGIKIAEGCPHSSKMPRQASPATDAAERVGRMVREHGAGVWRALRRLGVREADADDQCQEVFLVAHRQLPSFRGDSSERTWLYGIALRVASDYRRRAHVRREMLVEEVPDAEVPPPQEAALTEQEAVRQLDAALDTLDEDKRTVLVLYEIEQLAMADIAALVGCPVQTAYARLYAARKRLDAALAAQRDDRRNE